jgi:hypothetical protein
VLALLIVGCAAKTRPAEKGNEQGAGGSAPQEVMDWCGVGGPYQAVASYESGKSRVEFTVEDDSQGLVRGLSAD